MRKIQVLIRLPTANPIEVFWFLQILKRNCRQYSPQVGKSRFVFGRY